MKKALPYILVGAALYYFWYRMQQNKINDGDTFPPLRNPNDLIKPTLKDVKGFPNIF